jgi:hypothetical protein
VAGVKPTVGHVVGAKVGRVCSKASLPKQVFQTCEDVQSEMAGLGGDAAKC